MMRAPTMTAVRAAERKVAESRESTRAGLARASAGMHDKLTRPSTLATAAVAAGLFGWWLGRRPRVVIATPQDGTSSAASTSVAAIVFALFLRHGLQVLPLAIDYLRASARRRERERQYEA